MGELKVGEEGLSSYDPSSDIGGIGRSEEWLDSSGLLRGRQHKKKNKIPAIAAAARTPTIIPAIAPPDNDVLLPAFTLLALVEVGVAVDILVLVATAVEATVAEVGVELVVVDFEDVDVEDADDVVVVVSVLFSVIS